MGHLPYGGCPKGDLFHDLTQIRDITSAFWAQYGKPKVPAKGNASKNSITQADEERNPFSQNSMWEQEETVALREYMSGLTAEDMRSETERTLLRRYQEKLERYREALKRAEEAKSGSKEQQKQAGRMLRSAEQELKTYEKDGGIAQLMRDSQRVVNRYLLGKTREQVENDLQALNEEIGALREEIAQAGQAVAESREKAKNALARSAFRETDIRRAAREICAAYASGMSTNELENRLAEAWSELMTGKSTASEKIMALAADIVNRAKENGSWDANERIRDAMGGRLTLTEGQRNELKARGMKDDFRA